MDSLKIYRSSLKRLWKKGKCPTAPVSSTPPPYIPSPPPPTTNPFLVQAQKPILLLTFKDHIVPKKHLVSQACQMLAGGDSLALVKALISNLAVPPPPTPAEQHKLNAAFNKGMAKCPTHTYGDNHSPPHSLTTWAPSLQACPYTSPLPYLPIPTYMIPLLPSNVMLQKHFLSSSPHIWYILILVSCPPLVF